MESEEYDIVNDAVQRIIEDTAGWTPSVIFFRATEKMVRNAFKKRHDGKYCWKEYRRAVWMYELKKRRRKKRK